MIHAIGEMGGMRDWLRFFGDYGHGLERLRDLGAIPMAAPFSIAPVKEEENSEESPV